MPVLSTDSLGVFASQDTEWVEEKKMSASLRETEEPRSRCEKQNCSGHTERVFSLLKSFVLSCKDRLLWLHITISVLVSAVLRSTCLALLWLR